MTNAYRDNAFLPIVVVVLCIATGVYQGLLSITEGLYQFEGLILSIGIIIGIVGAVFLPSFWNRQIGLSALCFIAAIIAIGQFVVLPFAKHFYYFAPGSTWGYIVPAFGAGATLLSAVLYLTSRASGRFVLVAIAVAQFVVAVYVIHHSLKPKIDVFMFHQESAAALLEGRNPYAITFRNPYLEPDGSPSRFYSLEVQKDGRVMFGFPYPPMSMWLYLPSYWLTGESRYAHAAAFALAGLGIGLVSSGRAAKAAAVLWLTAPAAWVVIENAWTEPFLMLALVGVALTAVRAPAALPVALGVFLSLKQYNIIFLPLIFLILPRPLAWGTTVRFLAITVITGAVVSLPLAVWDWAAFWNSNVTIQVKQPFRYDAFSFLALFANAQPSDFEPPKWWSAIPFMLVVPTWGLLLWRMPRNIAGFVLGVGLTSIVFLFFNRQAFLNYHTFAAGTLLLAVACIEAVNMRKAETNDEVSTSPVEAPAAANP